ncbi:DUF2272 domain-containing protein [Roseomonas sp. KE2513]|uniref:DUF2272 domain-containing protein n=1 Tax=Roseomonas sp. KE2513 TaxID=2479202 RepID=UPI001E357FA0|nr:DUF2272 domain-containing protein [Roseomonas sp. KE2513]
MRLLPLLAVLLAACTTAPPPPAGGTPAERPRPGGAGAARLVAAAEGEWRNWGSIAVEGWPVALDRTPDATPALFDRLMTYWAATPEGPEVIAGHQHFRDTINAPVAASASLDPVSGLPFEVVPANVAISSYNTPAWSAAFVSHAMASAGVPRAEFDPSASHALYVDRLIAMALADPEGAAFLPRGLAERAPRPGDLVCADRSAEPLADWTARLSESGRFRPMHCDIVVRAGGGSVDLIGGNVLDVVLRRRLPADTEGHLMQAPPDRPPFFVVFENRR